MATHQITETQKAIVNGQNTAMEQWPTDLSQRQNLVAAFIRLRREEDSAIAKAKTAAKDKIGADTALKKLVKDYAYESDALKIIRMLDKMTDPEKRSRVCRQVYEIMKDQGYLIPELFDLGAIGNVQAGADDAPVFDKTGAGKARGGKKAEPKHMEPPAPQAQTGTGPGIPLDEAQRKLEEYLALNPRRPGAKPKALKELEAAVEAAKGEPEVQAQTSTTAVAGPDAPDDEAGGEFPELPAATGPLAPQLAAGVAESQAHIDNQVKNGVQAATAAEKKTRPTKAQKEAAAAAKAAEDAAAAAKVVPAPEAPDDDVPAFAELPPAKGPAPIGGTSPSTVRFAA